MDTNLNPRKLRKFSAILTGRLSLLFLLFFLCSCSDKNCEGIDCLPEYFDFTIKSASSGEDLLSGSNPQLTAADIEVFYLENGVEQPLPFDFAPGRVFLGIYKDMEEFYVRAMGKTDTVKLQVHRTSGKGCCPSMIKIDKILVNGGAITEDEGVVVLLR